MPVSSSRATPSRTWRTGTLTATVLAVTVSSPPGPVTSTYHPMTPPARLLDTRSGNGLGGRLLANTPATFQVSGRGGIPAGATAVTGNVTVVGPTNSWAVFL